MKKVLAMILAITMLGSLALTGCGDDKGKDDGKAFSSIANICGNLGDKGFSDIAWQGVQEFAEENGVEAKVIEYGSDNSKLQSIAIDAASNYDVVIGASNEILEYEEQGIAADYPDVYFINYDIAPNYEVKSDNVYCINYKQFEGDFLAGYLAVKMSATKHVGFVGGQEATVICDFLVGYIDGALQADANAKVASAYIGNYTDTAKGKELANVQMQQNNCDIIHAVAGSGGLGVFAAMAENGAAGKYWAIGVDADQYSFFAESDPDTAAYILTSSLKRNDVALKKILGQTMDGSAEYGTLVKYGAAEDVTVLAENDYYKQMVPADIQQEITDLKGKLSDMDIHCAYYMTQDEITAFANSVKP